METAARVSKRITQVFTKIGNLGKSGAWTRLTDEMGKCAHPQRHHHGTQKQAVDCNHYVEENQLIKNALGLL